MEYHFVVPKTTLKKRTLSFPLLVIPLLVLGAALPFLLTYVFSPSSLNYTSSADTQPELRIWFSPSRISARVGEEVTLTVKANFDGSEQLIPSLRIQVDSDNLTLKNNMLFYPKPFRGEVTLGTVSVKATKAGNAIVTIPKASIKIDPPVDNVNVFVSSANFAVK